MKVITNKYETDELGNYKHIKSLEELEKEFPDLPIGFIKSCTMFREKQITNNQEESPTRKINSHL